uniref:Sulfotransferase n=1 Tax=Leptobrachium leishanense TaxID=445787 RepID=A0A8C5WID0_9ANUR
MNALQFILSLFLSCGVNTASLLSWLISNRFFFTKMDEVTPVQRNCNLFRYKGYCFLKQLHNKESVDALQDFLTREDDVFLVTFPKSGTVWTQHILSLICSEGYRKGTENTSTIDTVPWFDFNLTKQDYDEIPSPRLFVTHLSPCLVPRDLKNKKGKVIYVIRNPKDVMTSMYYFNNMAVLSQKQPNFGKFMEAFLSGDVYAGSWFDHVRGWYTHKDDFNILYIKYEDMIMDLRSVVKQICTFIGREMDEASLNNVAEKAAFKEMKKDPRANREDAPEELVDKSKGTFMRKGTIGDWKNEMTVAQSEQFDALFEEQMKDLPLNFTWDLPKKPTC